MKRRLAALAVTCTLCWPVTPGWAADRLDRVRVALAASPLFVDPYLADQLTPAERHRVSQALRPSSVPVYVVVIPLLKADESQGRAEVFLHAVRARLGRDGVYVVADQYESLDYVAFNVPRDLEISTEILYRPPGSTTPLSHRLLQVIDAIHQSPPGPATSPTPDPPPQTLQYGHKPRPLRHAAVGFFLVGPGATLLTLWALGSLWKLLSRRVAATRGEPARSTFDEHAPARPSQRWLRRQADAELAELREALLHSSDRNRGSPAATAALDAALLAAKQHGDPLALVGAIVLARAGRSALVRRKGRPAVPCFANPLHGRAVRDVAKQLPNLPRRRVPLCRTCRRAKEDRLDDLVLKIEIDGESYAHYEVPGIWQATGFGAFEPQLSRAVLEHLGVE